MTDRMQLLEPLKGNQSTNIRMSKLDRIIQSATARTNWSEMAKMLSWTDEDQNTQREIGKLISPDEKLALAGFNDDNFVSGQFHYTLILMVIISIAQKRTQEPYERDFSQRCDAISKTYSLNDDQYWPAGKVPAEWEELNAEFERISKKILVETLREYDQKEIADLVQDEGPEQIFNAIQNIKSQYLNAINNWSPVAKDYFKKRR